MTIRQFLWKIQHACQDILFPQGVSCHVCQQGLMENNILCPACSKQFLKERFCTQDALKHGYPQLEGCLAGCSHEGVVRKLIHQLKYESNASTVDLLGEVLCVTLQQAPEIYAKIEAVVPVPLHPLREEQRGYNQAALLAQEVCFHTGLPMVDRVLVRTRETHSQVRRSREQRLKAMRGVFDVTDTSVLEGKCVLLVDDVLTTGATAMACAQTLLQHGTKSVYLLTVCRADKKKTGSK